METNLEKAKRLIKAHAEIIGIDMPDNGYIFEMMELAATPNEINKKNINHNIHGSLPLSEMPRLFEWIKERQIDLDGNVWVEYVGHDTPNEYTTAELYVEFKRGNNQ